MFLVISRKRVICCIRLHGVRLYNVRFYRVRFFLVRDYRVRIFCKREDCPPVRACPKIRRGPSIRQCVHVSPLACLCACACLPACCRVCLSACLCAGHRPRPLLRRALSPVQQVVFVYREPGSILPLDCGQISRPLQLVQVLVVRRLGYPQIPQHPGLGREGAGPRPGEGGEVGVQRLGLGVQPGVCHHHPGQDAVPGPPEAVETDGGKNPVFPLPRRLLLEPFRVGIQQVEVAGKGPSPAPPLDGDVTRLLQLPPVLVVGVLPQP